MYKQDWNSISTMLEPGSGVNWCEVNYAVTNHVAEFFNTLSNIPLIVLPLLALKLQRRYLVWNKLALAAYVLMSITGCMSAYYHATLNLFGQILDELAIFWGLMAGYIAWLPVATAVPPFITNHVTFWRIVAGLFAVVSSVMCFVNPSLNNFIMFFVLLPPTLCLVYSEAKSIYLNPDNGPENKMLKRALVSSGLAMFGWLLDKLFCQTWIYLGIPYWHAVWHVFIGLATYHTITFYSYCDARKNMQTAKCCVVLRWVPNIPYCPSVPYVDLVERGTYLE